MRKNCRPLSEESVKLINFLATASVGEMIPIDWVNKRTVHYHKQNHEKTTGCKFKVIPMPNGKSLVRMS